MAHASSLPHGYIRNHPESRGPLVAQTSREWGMEPLQVCQFGLHDPLGFVDCLVRPRA